MKQSISVILLSLLLGVTVSEAQIKYLNKIIVPFKNQDAVCKAVAKYGSYYYACGSLKPDSSLTPTGIFVIKTTGNPDSIQKFEWTPPDSGVSQCSADFIQVDSSGDSYIGINCRVPSPLYADRFYLKLYIIKLSPEFFSLWTHDNRNILTQSTSAVMTQLRVTKLGNVLVQFNSYLGLDTSFNHVAASFTMDKTGEHIYPYADIKEYTDTSYTYFSDVVINTDSIIWRCAVKRTNSKYISPFLTKYFLGNFPLRGGTINETTGWGEKILPIKCVPEKLALDESGFVFLSSTDYDSTEYIGAIKKHSSTIAHVDPMDFTSTYLDNFRLTSSFSRLKYITLRSQEGGSTIFSTGNRFDPAHSNTSNIITVCFTSDGNKLWEKETNMSPGGLSEYPNGITLGHNFTTTVTGNYTDTASPLKETNGFILSYDRYGNTIDPILLGDQGISLFAQMSDGNNTIAAGSILQKPGGNKEAYILSFDPMPLSVSPFEANSRSISITPNPASNQTNINFNLLNGEHHIQIGLCDGLGRTVLQIPTQSNQADEQHILVSTKDLPNGLYWVRLRSELGFQIAPLVIRK